MLVENPLLLHLMKYALKTLAFLVLCSFCQLTAAQNPQQLDSISTVLRNAPNKLDTMLLNRLNAHAFKYRRVNADSSLALAFYAKNLCEKANFLHGTASAYTNIGIAYRIKGIPEKAIEFHDKSLNISKINNDLQGISASYSNIGNIYGQMGDAQKAIEYHKKSLAADELLGDQAGIAASCGNIGVNLYMFQGDYIQALDYFFRAEAICNKLADKNMLAEVWENIANIYGKQRNTEFELKYYDKSLKLAQKLNNQNLVASVLYNSAEAYTNKSNYRQALANYFSVLEIVKKTGNQLIIPSTLASIGMVYYKQKNYNESLSYFEKSLVLAENLENEGDKTYALQGLALAYFKLNKIEKALEYAKKGLSLAYAIEDTELIRDGHNILYEIYKHKKDYAKALNSYEKYKIYYDSLYNAETERAMATLGAKNEFDKKEAKIKEQQEEQKQEYETKKQKQQLFTIFALLAFVLAATTAFVVYRSRKKIQLASEEIKQKNEEISTQSEQLAESNTVKDKLFSVISHDLRSPLGSLQNSLELLEDQTFSPKEFTDVSQNISQSLKGLLFMLENLLQWSYAQIKGDYLRKEKFNITQLLEQNQALFSNTSQLKNIDLHLKNKNNIEVYAEKNQIDLVVRNLINNAIKFTNKKGKIDIDFTLKSNEVIVSVTDNGIGIAPEKLNTIFNSTVMDVEVGTANEKGTGLGLFLCKEMVERNNGKIWVENNKDAGVTFYFSVPLAQN